MGSSKNDIMLLKLITIMDKQISKKKKIGGTRAFYKIEKYLKKQYKLSHNVSYVFLDLNEMYPNIISRLIDFYQSRNYTAWLCADGNFFVDWS